MSAVLLCSCLVSCCCTAAVIDIICVVICSSMETKDGEIVFSIHIYNAGLDTYDDKGKAAGGGIL